MEAYLQSVSLSERQIDQIGFEHAICVIIIVPLLYFEIL
jgi:hypothetical protein